LWNAEGVTMENLIRAKIDQMWQIATSDACGKHSSAVADLHREISKLLQKLEPSQLEEN
jgi:tRNA U34 5-carboxymethylaminomethyl modifying GTPase MnmE/TrmE